jgi:hypothetical protein
MVEDAVEADAEMTKSYLLIKIYINNKASYL